MADGCGPTPPSPPRCPPPRYSQLHRPPRQPLRQPAELQAAAGDEMPGAAAGRRAAGGSGGTPQQQQRQQQRQEGGGRGAGLAGHGGLGAAARAPVPGVPSLTEPGAARPPASQRGWRLPLMPRSHCQGGKTLGEGRCRKKVKGESGRGVRSAAGRQPLRKLSTASARLRPAGGAPSAARPAAAPSPCHVTAATPARSIAARGG